MRMRTSRQRRPVSGLVALAVTASLALGIYAAPAGAAEEEISADEITELVAQASPDGAETVEGTETGAGLQAESEGTATAVPLDAEEPISVSTTVAEREVEAEITLPLAETVGEGEVTDDGTVVYPESAASGGTAIAVQTLEGGDTRVQTILTDADAATEYRYGMEGYQAVIDEQGNAGFVSNDAEGLYIPVEAAWATDANGVALDTSYEERDGELWQVIVTTPETAFPVVADPTWGWKNAAWGLTMNRSEVMRIKDYSSALGMCGIIALKFKNGAVYCGAYSSYILTQAITANRPDIRGCLHVVVAPVPGAILHVKCGR